MEKHELQEVLNALKIFSTEMNGRFDSLENRMGSFETRMEKLENRVDQLENTMNERFDRLEKKK